MKRSRSHYEQTIQKALTTLSHNIVIDVFSQALAKRLTPACPEGFHLDFSPPNSCQCWGEAGPELLSEATYKSKCPISKHVSDRLH